MATPLRSERVPGRSPPRDSRAAPLVAALLLAFVPRVAHAVPPDGCPGPSLGSGLPPPASMPWTDATLPPETRAELLLGEMTLEEKVDLETGESCLVFGYYNAPIDRLGIPPLTMADGPAGIRIPYQRVNGGRATALAAPIAVAATWDPALAESQGDLLATEALATGYNVVLGPTLDLVRTPLAGRDFESFGEDPLLASRMAVPFIRGIQKHPVLADAKHYAVYNQEDERFTIDARVGEQALRELYLVPFEAAVRDADVGSVMCGFNRVDGVFACEDGNLIEGVLKGEMGFRGFVLSDWSATRDTVANAMAGLDQELAFGRYFGQKLVDAVRAGEVPPAVVDDKARRILGSMFRFGLFDHPVVEQPIPEHDHGGWSRLIAEQGIVLLKNRGALLPLASSGVRSIAVIGADATNGSAEGGGAARVEPTYVVSPLDGIRARAGPGVRVAWAPGTDPVTPADLLSAAPAVPSSVLSPPGDPATRGLRAEYWLNDSFAGPPDLVQVDRQMAVSAGFFAYQSVNASSVPEPPLEYALTRFSARWTGTLAPPATGEYTLELTSRGQAWLWIDGALVIDDPSPHGLSSRTVTVHLDAGAPHDVRLDYSADSDEIGRDTDVGGDVELSWTPPAGATPPAIREAAALAASSDVAVVFLRDYGTEGRDRPDLALSNGQDELVRAVAAANPRTVVVLTTGAPAAMPWLDAVPAVVQAWYPGQEQGSAIARVLFGDVNPSGKLPVTFPRALADAPVGTAPDPTDGEGPVASYAEGVLLGYRWYDARGIEPLFPFGHGLSYTTFRYSALAVSARGAAASASAPAASVSFTLANTGAREGAEVAQVYVGSCRGDGPPRRLAGFAKVSLAPGSSARVAVDVSPEALSTWNVGSHAWELPRCDVRVYVGSSSRDLRLTGAIRAAALRGRGP